MKKIIAIFIVLVTTITLSGCSLFSETDISVKSIYTGEKYTFNLEVTRKDNGLQDYGIVGFESKLSLSHIVSKIQENKDYDIEIKSRNNWCELYINNEEFYLFKDNDRNWYTLSSNLIFDDTYCDILLFPMHLINVNSIDTLRWFDWNSEIKINGPISEVIEYYTSKECYTVKENENEYTVTFTKGHLTELVDESMVSFNVTFSNSGIKFNKLNM